jgi:hypothetical protein
MILVPPSEVALVSPLLVLQGLGVKTLRLAQASKCGWWNGYFIPAL